MRRNFAGLPIQQWQFEQYARLWGVLFFVFFGLAVWMQGASNRLYATRKRYSFRCLLCGYQWVWATGEPLPPVQDRPDLRQAGEARLRAEDAAAQHVAEDILWRKPWDQK